MSKLSKAVVVLSMIVVVTSGAVISPIVWGDLVWLGHKRLVIQSRSLTLPFGWEASQSNGATVLSKRRYMFSLQDSSLNVSSFSPTFNSSGRRLWAKGHGVVNVSPVSTISCGPLLTSSNGREAEFYCVDRNLEFRYEYSGSVVDVEVARDLAVQFAASGR